MDIKFIPSPNYSKRKDDIKLIVIHWTGGRMQPSIDWLCNPEAKASAHYCIDRDGNIVQLVKEEDKAWHAGKSYLEGYGDNLNNCSIGIELEGPPSTLDLEWWYRSQIVVCAELIKDIKSRYPDIKITDHSTISPGRKVDVKMGTGVNKFPWDLLLELGDIEEA